MTTGQQARLKDLPTLGTLDLVPGVQIINEGGSFRASQKNFHSVTLNARAVLADVREGGLKRDLSALKGALQAALDYDGADGKGPEVTINKNFRAIGRALDAEVNGIGFAFPDAAKGPAAYGSSAYVDQADVLREFAEQLTPRGDTFVIRTYGDSLDAAGKVVARAWCEAVVQRSPDYLDATDANHRKSSELQSNANKRFGRSFQIVSFRWLDASEI